MREEEEEKTKNWLRWILKMLKNPKADNGCQRGEGGSRPLTILLTYLDIIFDLCSEKHAPRFKTITTATIIIFDIAR